MRIFTLYAQPFSNSFEGVLMVVRKTKREVLYFWSSFLKVFWGGTLGAPSLPLCASMYVDQYQKNNIKKCDFFVVTGDGDWGHVGAVHPAGGGDRVGGEELPEHGPPTEEDAGQPTRQKDHGTAGTCQSTGSRNVRYFENFLIMVLRILFQKSWKNEKAMCQ